MTSRADPEPGYVLKASDALGNLGCFGILARFGPERRSTWVREGEGKGHGSIAEPEQARFAGTPHEHGSGDAGVTYGDRVGSVANRADLCQRRGVVRQWCRERGRRRGGRVLRHGSVTEPELAVDVIAPGLEAAVAVKGVARPFAGGDRGHTRRSGGGRRYHLNGRFDRSSHFSIADLP